jgi:hypothetical protein
MSGSRIVATTSDSPINGCIISPDSGPATNTIAMLDLLNPRDIRYGEATTSVSADNTH